MSRLEEMQLVKLVKNTPISDVFQSLSASNRLVRAKERSVIVLEIRRFASRVKAGNCLRKDGLFSRLKCPRNYASLVNIK